MTKNILLVGVGGQGTILASKLLTLGLMQSGVDVKMSEIHGMSQRGGSVVSHIRYSDDKVYSSVVEKGSADILVAFEKMEALRYLDYLRKGAKVVVNDYEIPSMPIYSGLVEYPKGIIECLQRNADVVVIKANDEASTLGNAKAMNMVMLGTIIKLMNLEHIDWDSIIEQNVKPAYVQLNKQALARGMQLAE
ncbi:MAG: indolepyruvate oxidoreductase subunit beta [Clostridia bacterium]|nr:indolepyruvate oxidoreductase subunit beta [Clostridia bacterium]